MWCRLVPRLRGCGTECGLVMPRGRRAAGREVAVAKKKERLVREALRRERKSGAYLDPADPDFRSFRDQLQAQGLKLHEVPSDGNCLFHSLSDQLQADSHRNIRRSVVGYMREHREDFQPFLDDGVSFEDHLIALSKDGEYAGNDAIVAFARCYSVNVVIHQLNAPRWEVLGSRGAEGNTLHVAYLNGEHYCPVQPILASQKLPCVASISQGSSSQTPPRRVNKGEGASGTLSNAQEAVQRMVLETTGCKDPVLVEQCLLENGYDPDLAIVELLQLISLTDGCGYASSDSSSCSPNPPSSAPPSKVESRAKPPPKASTKSATCKVQVSQRHLSNRERKEQAKAARKQRRVEEQRLQGEHRQQEADPVGAVAI